MDFDLLLGHMQVVAGNLCLFCSIPPLADMFDLIFDQDQGILCGFIGYFLKSYLSISPVVWVTYRILSYPS